MKMLQPLIQVIINSTQNLAIMVLKQEQNLLEVYQNLCLGNTSEDWTVDDMRITGLNGYTYDVSVDYYAIAIDDIFDIHKYLMKKIILYKMFEFIKQIFISAMMFLVVIYQM